MYVPLDHPLLVVEFLPRQQRQAEILDGVEALHPRGRRTEVRLDRPAVFAGADRSAFAAARIPADGAPRAVQGAADVFPLTHLLGAARAIMIEGAGLTDLTYNVGALVLMSVVFLATRTAMFRWTQD